MYYCHQLKKMAIFSGQVQQYRGTELISFWKRQYYSPNQRYRGTSYKTKQKNGKYSGKVQQYRGTKVHSSKSVKENIKMVQSQPGTEVKR